MRVYPLTTDLQNFLENNFVNVYFFQLFQQRCTGNHRKNLRIFILMCQKLNKFLGSWSTNIVFLEATDN
jgi:hypothetical protein